MASRYGSRNSQETLLDRVIKPGTMGVFGGLSFLLVLKRISPDSLEVKPMRLKILAISDTHLGEDSSLLSFPHGRQHLWRTLRTILGGDGQVEVEEMILLGDIPDRTLSSTSQIITHTNAFIQMLGSAADVKKGVYVLGNHDHTLWTGYRKLRYGEEGQYGITEPAGDLIVEKGERCDENESATEFLSIFFGYPAGSAWRKIEEERKFNFSVANPLYATEINGRSYVFAHGTHFRQDVTSPKWIKRLADYLEVDELLGDIELESDCDVNEASNLEELEQIAAPFVDSLWPSPKNNPTPRSDQFWYLLTTLSGKFGKKRPTPEGSELFSGAELPQTPESRIRRLTANNEIKHDSIERWKEYFLPHMRAYLGDNDMPTNKITFVYGDTHDGGWGELPLGSRGRVRLYNCGGWVVHNHEDHAPCHLFAVDESGEEYLLDVSYKDVKVEEDLLLALAADEAENRYRKTSRILRFLLKLLPIG